MNILLISQCAQERPDRNRRILDQFAERRGDRSYWTAIAQQGPRHLYRLLRKTARKNTAVACHWIRGGTTASCCGWWVMRGSSMPRAVPTNTTKRNILRRELGTTGMASRASPAYVPGGHAARPRQSLPGLSDGGTARGAPLRAMYTGMSGCPLRFFQAFVGDSTDDAWLQRSLEPSASDDALAGRGRLLRDRLDTAARQASPSPSCRRWPGP